MGMFQVCAWVDMFLSAEADASKVPVGFQATDQTLSWCPFK